MPPWLSAEAAVAPIPDGSPIYISGNAATPRALLRALSQRSDLHQGLQVGHVLLLGQDPFGRDGASPFRHRAWFVGPADREAVHHGRADYVPVHLHQIPRVIAEGPPLSAALLSASPPDRHGWMSLGVEVMASMAALRRAGRVIVQVNEQMPRVHGDAFLHVDQVDSLVRGDEALPEREPEPIDEVQRSIAARVLELIPEHATLQMGIGGVPDAVLQMLEGRRDIGIHSEMVSDGLVEAVQKGLVTGRHKSLHPGKALITFALGTRRLYDFLSDNPMVEAHPCDYINDPFVIARNDRMVAINQALSIDLTGQICADSIGPRVYSGVGGQVDFLRGAAGSRGGVPIIALPSTARGGALSRIVPTLSPGSGVVTPRADAHHIITEHGAVNLFGRSIAERARLLIRLAAPQFREGLEREARGLGLLAA